MTTKDVVYRELLLNRGVMPKVSMWGSESPSEARQTPITVVMISTLFVMLQSDIRISSCTTIVSPLIKLTVDCTPPGGTLSNGSAARPYLSLDCLRTRQRIIPYRSFTKLAWRSLLPDQVAVTNLSLCTTCTFLLSHGAASLQYRRCKTR